jgi:hypothetical protein
MNAEKRKVRIPIFGIINGPPGPISPAGGHRIPRYVRDTTASSL